VSSSTTGSSFRSSEWKSNGFVEHRIVKTPNIDALAAAGVRFDKAYCQFPLCNPSRTSMLTGRYPVVTGVLGNRSWFGKDHPDYVSLPSLFKDHGYKTLRSGKVFHGGIDDSDAWTEGGEARRLAGVAPGATKKAAAKAKGAGKAEGVLTSEEEARADQARGTRRSDAIYVIPSDGDNVGDGAVATRADLDNDPRELKNLAHDSAFADVRKRLSSLVRRHREGASSSMKPGPSGVE
jgi:Sulfatase